MLTALQKSVVDRIPDEGSLTYEKLGETVDIGIDMAQRLVCDAFDGHVPPPPGAKQVLILQGHPGSGKTFLSRTHLAGLSRVQRLGTIVVSYDEAGAIYAIPEYVRRLKEVAPDYRNEHEPVSAASLEARRRLWQVFQPASQAIRALTLKGALQREFSLIVDTTSSSVGTRYLIEALRTLDYKSVHMLGAFAPFAVSRERIERRPRPTSPVDDLVGKRIGALEWLGPYADMTDKFEFYYNPGNDHAATLAFRIEEGRLTLLEPDAVNAIQSALSADREEINAYLKEMNVPAAQAEDLMARYDAARVKFIDVLNRLGQGKPAVRLSDPGPA